MTEVHCGGRSKWCKHDLLTCCAVVWLSGKV